jgi:hypothetical protein
VTTSSAIELLNLWCLGEGVYEQRYSEGFLLHLRQHRWGCLFHRVGSLSLSLPFVAQGHSALHTEDRSPKMRLPNCCVEAKMLQSKIQRRHPRERANVSVLGAGSLPRKHLLRTLQSTLAPVRASSKTQSNSQHCLNIC